ncbi:metalloprotease m41 ftsh [Holotrichia oblita]|nr:metalloprotease m41 ftsh [Holotrichia oblita]
MVTHAEYYGQKQAAANYLQKAAAGKFFAGTVMAGITFNHVYKIYDGGIHAVSDFSMHIEDKEFIAIVGPSGSGKTTVLRMIAGLEEITSGQIVMDGRIINNLPPKDRDIAMVFQRYALFPHFTVYDNIAIGLHGRGISREETDKRVRETAEFLGLNDCLGPITIGSIVMYVNAPISKRYDEFYESLNAKKVASIVVTNDTAEYKLKNDKKTYTTYIRVEDENYQNALAIAISDGMEYSVNNRYATNWASYLPYLFLLIIMGLIAYYVVRSIGRENRHAANFSRSRAVIPTNTKIKFSDVAGAEEEKEELKEIVEFLKEPQRFTAVGARIPKGALLVGPPGTGKTLFAKAVAGEAGVPFFSVSGSDFVEMYVGVGASRVKDLFETARKNMPCIVFIDEIDAVGRKRGAGLGGGHDEREQTLNQLLVQMDGFADNEGIVILAATNRQDILDPALLRPGRFDRQIYVNLPDVRGREAIFKIHSRNKPMDSDVNFQIISRITSGFSGADIENILNEAAIICGRNGRKKINMSDVQEGISKIMMGPSKKSRLITDYDKRITAYHEAGHAIVAKCSPYCDSVHEVSIIPRGLASGYTLTRPDDDNDHLSKLKLTAELAMRYGGRAAEEIVIKDISAGASSDIRVNTARAKHMVTEWGMSEDLGPIFYGADQEVFLGRDYGTSHSYSESVAAKIDTEVGKILSTAHKDAVQILEAHRKELDVMARVLIECETIYSEEVDLIMSGKSAEEVKQFIKDKTERKIASKLGVTIMKKLTKKTVAIIAVIAVLGVTILTLGLVRIRQDKYFFDDYKYFQVYNLSTSSPFPSIEDKVAPKLKTTSFSVLAAMLEGQFGYKPSIVKDDDGEPVYLKKNAVEYMSATSERYLLHFVYDDEPRSITVEGQKYLYNRAFVLLQEGNGEIVEVKVVPYVFDRVYNDSDGASSSDLYEIPDLRIKMRTSALYVSIENAIAEMA